ncbi:MAG: HIT domain-containing protein [Chthoniobacteraceae bacterium]|nr:HIT domain-containing protein [Chthoniobacteraceae bacterium]
MAFPESLQAVWAPWRVEYFSIDKSRDFLAEAAQSSDDRAHLVVRRLKDTFLLMNRFPYTVGHLMAVPYRKVADIADLTPGEQAELWDQAAFAQRILRKVVHAEGFNIGLNLGKAGGAGVADHLHLHIVPRWEGDNNFMPVLGNVRVMAESLDALYAKLVEADAS